MPYDAPGSYDPDARARLLLGRELRDIHPVLSLAERRAAGLGGEIGQAMAEAGAAVRRAERAVLRAQRAMAGLVD